MNDLQPYFAIGLPIVANSAMMILGFTLLSNRITDLRTDVNTRFSSLESRMDVLIGKVAELDNRVSVIDDRMQR
jgi:hypothetical protein